LLQAGLDGAWPLPDDSLMRRLQLLLADQALSREQAISMVILLLFAGHETSAALIGSAVYLLHAHPQQRHRLQADPDLLLAFIEESARLESPLQRSTFRMTACEHELNGQYLAAGEQVCVLLGCANRDETAFADSESFQIDRSPNPHLAFGRGNYHCIGRHLATLEVSVVLQILMQRFPASSLAGEPIWNVNGFLRSLQNLPVSLQA
jgi:cytochrome P450